MFNKLIFGSWVFGIAMWCGAATWGQAPDAPAPAPPPAITSHYAQKGQPSIDLGDVGSAQSH